MRKVAEKFLLLTVLGFYAFVFLLSVTHLPSIRVQVHQVDVSRYPDITVYFTIFNVRNLPIVGARKEQITLQEDGRIIPDFELASAETTGQKMNISILLDVSGSMKAEMKLEAAKSALKAFFQELDPTTEISLITFADSATTLHPFGKTVENWDEVIRRVSAEGTQTILYDAVYEGLKQLAGQAPARKAIVLLTDGKDEGSVTTLEDVVRLVSDLGVPIFSIAFGSDADQRVLSRLARISGGISLTATDPADLIYLYSLISQQLASQYAVTYMTSQYPGTGRHIVMITYQSGEIEAWGTRDFEIPAGTPIRPFRRAQPLLVSLSGPLASTAAVALLLIASLFVLKSFRKTKKVCPQCGNELAPEQTECQFCAKKTAPAPTSSSLPWAEPGINRTLVIRREKERMAVLKIVGAVKGTQEYLLQLPRTLVGSSQDCDLSLQEEGFVPEHFVIRKEDGTYILQDLGSETGTLLNNERVQGKVNLKNGDRIRVGKVIFVFREIEMVTSPR